MRPLQVLQTPYVRTPLAMKASPSPHEFMIAALHQGIRDVALTTMPRPRVAAGHVLIHVEATGICGSDLWVYRHVAHSLNAPRGHEYCGTVVEVADDVVDVAAGDRVTVDVFLNASCGCCRYCQSGEYLHCTEKANPFTEGGFSEFVAVRAKAVFKLPVEVDRTLGALAEPVAVAVHAVRKLNLRPGMSGLILGGGTIGLAALVASLDAGAGPMHVVTKHTFQGDLALTLGATSVSRPEDQDAHQQLVRASGGGLDFAIEAVGGSAPTLDLACQVLRPGGALAILGAFEDGVRNLEIIQALRKELSLYFSNCYGRRDGRHDYQEAIGLLARRGSTLRQLVTHKFSLGDIIKAYHTADDKRFNSIKVQIQI